MNKIYAAFQTAQRQLFANVAKTAEQKPELLKARGLTDGQIAKIKEVANARAEQCAVQHSAKQD